MSEQEIIEQIAQLKKERDSIEFFEDDPEMDGVNLSQQAQYNRIDRKITQLEQSICKHDNIFDYEWGSSIYNNYIITECEDCGKEISRKNISLKSDEWI